MTGNNNTNNNTNNINNIFLLPHNIIENVITSNKNIITTYDIVLKMSKYNINEFKKIKAIKKNKKNKLNNSRKRKRVVDIEKDEKDINTHNAHNIYNKAYKFLINPITINNIYSKSIWYKYFMNCKNFDDDNNNQIKQIKNDIKLLKPFLINNNNSTDNNINNLINNNPIEYIEKYISSIENIEKLDLLISKILHRWNCNINDLPSIVILILLLYSGNAINKYTCFELDNLYNLYNNHNCDYQDGIDKTNACYNKVQYGTIHLLQYYLGCGYSYNIAWDLHKESLIGFIYGGSNGYDYEFYDNNLLLYLKKNIEERKTFIRENKIHTSIKKIFEYINNNYNNQDMCLYKYEKAAVNYN
jgi:hypothetical protein